MRSRAHPATSTRRWQARPASSTPGPLLDDLCGRHLPQDPPEAHHGEDSGKRKPRGIVTPGGLVFVVVVVFFLFFLSFFPSFLFFLLFLLFDLPATRAVVRLQQLSALSIFFFFCPRRSWGAGGLSRGDAGVGFLFVGFLVGVGDVEIGVG